MTIRIYLFFLLPTIFMRVCKQPPPFPWFPLLGYVCKKAACRTNHDVQEVDPSNAVNVAGSLFV